MHYKNGREAKAGDMVFRPGIYSGEKPKVGILYNLEARATTCNAQLASMTPNDECVTVGDCVHIDDVKAAFEERVEANKG